MFNSYSLTDVVIAWAISAVIFIYAPVAIYATYKYFQQKAIDHQVSQLVVDKSDPLWMFD